MSIRYLQILCVASIAFFLSLVVFNNITDHTTNFIFVQHVLLMDTISENVRWRAITSPFLHHLAYNIIILWEAIAALLCIKGSVVCYRSRHQSVALFNRAKAPAIIGLTMGLLLWLVGFIGIAGEWFLMWQSPQWNAQSTALHFVIIMALMLLVMLHSDKESKIF